MIMFKSPCLLIFAFICVVGTWWLYISYESHFSSYVTLTWKGKNVSDLQPKQELLFFNRVPKTGSEMTVLLLQWLQGINNFRHVRLPNFVERRLSSSEEAEMWQILLNFTRESPDLPVSFDRHIYFSDFRQFLGPQSQFIYFSSVRDPVEKFISRFYYDRATPKPGLQLPANVARSPSPKSNFQEAEECIRARDPECTFETGKHYDLTIPYFCGNAAYCTELNNEDAYRRALDNVERFYPVVGVLEEMNCTLRLLEAKLPKFFAGVQDTYYNELLEPKKNKNTLRPRTIDVELREMLRRNLSLEYKFYDAVRTRLETQCQLL